MCVYLLPLSCDSMQHSSLNAEVVAVRDLLATKLKVLLFYQRIEEEFYLRWVHGDVRSNQLRYE